MALPVSHNEDLGDFWDGFEGEKTLQNLILHFANNFEVNDFENKRNFAIDIVQPLIGKPFQERKLLNLVEKELAQIDLTKIRVNLSPQRNNSKDTISIFDADKLDGNSFQDFVAKLLESNGYSKVSVIGKSGDQGGDLLATREDEQIVIQAKRYSIDKRVTNGAVQEVLGAIGWYNADKGIVITNSFFTTSAKELARINNIELWDRKKVSEFIENHNSLTESKSLHKDKNGI